MRQGGRLSLWEQRRAQKLRAAEAIARRARPPLPPLEDLEETGIGGGLAPVDHAERALEDCPAELRGYFPDADRDL